MAVVRVVRQLEEGAGVVKEVVLLQGKVVGRGERSVQRRGGVGEGEVKGDVSYQTISAGC